MMKVALGKGEDSGPRAALARFAQRVIDDFRHKELMPIKVLFFVQSSTLFVLYPFLTIHMKELGIGVEEAAAMNALSPFVAVLMPPLAGLLADRIGNFRLLLSVLSAIGGGVSLLLLLVPPARIYPALPTQLSMVLEEVDNGSFVERALLVKPLPSHLPCTFTSSADGAHPMEFTLGQCGYSCPIQNGTKATPSPQNSTLNQTSDDQLPESRVFLPDQLSVSFQCGSNCTLRRPSLFLSEEWSPDDSAILINATVKRMEGSNNSNVLHMEALVDRVDELRIVGASGEGGNGGRWGRETDKGREVAAAWISATEEGPAEFCRAACLITTPRDGVCKEMVSAEAVANNPKLTFWLYLLIRVLLGAVGGTAFAMFEGAVIALLRRHDADYGLQRIYAALGAMLASPLSGLLLDAGGSTDFRPAFYLYAALKVVSGLMVLTIDLEFKSPAKRVIKEVVAALKNWELVTILVASLALGAAWGFLEGFLFWLLQDLGATKMLMGLTVTVGGAAGLPLLALAGPITDRIGHHAVIAISFLVYAIRLLGYSLLVNPWLCLVFEAMEGVTSSLAVTACVTAVASRSKTSTDSSLQGLLGGLYYGVGRGVGSLVGGLLMGAIGVRQTFRLFSGMCAVVGVIYLWTSRGAFGKSPKEKESEEQKEKAGEDGTKDVEGGVIAEKYVVKEDLKGVECGVIGEKCEEKKEAKGGEKKDVKGGEKDTKVVESKEKEEKSGEKKATNVDGEDSSETNTEKDVKDEEEVKGKFDGLVKDLKSSEGGVKEGHVNMALEMGDEETESKDEIKTHGK